MEKVKPRVLLTEPIIEPVQDFLRSFSQLDIGTRGEFNSESRLLEVIDSYNYVLSMLTSPITKSVLEKGKNLKLVANYAVGFNNIDTKSAKALGIHVANTPDVLTEATADTTLALLLTVTRKIFQADKDTRNGLFDGWHPTSYLGLDFRNKIFGIMGMGRIGQAVAKRVKAFGFSVHYHNRNQLDKSIEKDLDATYHTSLESLLTVCDVLSIHCPLTPENHHRINKNTLNFLKDGAYIINTARGPIIDEQALAQALLDGRIAGAGLDVFELEPKIHPLLLKASNTVLLPHIGSATLETRIEIGMLAAKAIHYHFLGKVTQIPNLIC